MCVILIALSLMLTSLSWGREKIMHTVFHTKHILILVNGLKISRITSRAQFLFPHDQLSLNNELSVNKICQCALNESESCQFQTCFTP